MPGTHSQPLDTRDGSGEIPPVPAKRLAVSASAGVTESQLT